MRAVSHPPDAYSIINSLRAIGYSFNTALADIIDNSLAAGAKNIDIAFRSEPEPYLAILDDGIGMSPAVLMQAMKHGGNGPDQSRAAEDLGRYGLGLKTASMSQCRRLSVITLHEGILSAARWDLDLVESHNEWILQLLEGTEPDVLPRVDELRKIGHGTIVLWQQFDRATAGAQLPGRALEKLVDESHAHLSLVFHRYIAPAGRDPGCAISINSLALEPYDPFMISNPFTEALPRERLVLDGGTVDIQPYILPHLSNISASEMRKAGGSERLRQTQGFYVYRNRRLITYGTWFRLVRHDELSKLARVRIDITNSLDHLWGLDVKKSTASPPEAVRATLRRITDRIASRGANVFRERRRRAHHGDTVHVWERSKIRGATIYSVNRDHPVFSSLISDLTQGQLATFEQAVRTLEIALPTDAIYADMAGDEPVEQPAEELALSLMALARSMLETAGADTVARARLLAALSSFDPFSMYPAHTRQIVETLRNG